MENIRDLVIEAFENTYEYITNNDKDYQQIEKEKIELLIKLKSSLKDEDYQKIELLIECLESQTFIVAMGFSFVRVLDLNKLMEKL